MHNFHGDEVAPSPPDSALFHVLPVPLEKTVSYGTGTCRGPEAILEASTQLELFDTYSTPAEYGIHTLPPVDCSPDITDVLKEVAQCVASTAAMAKIPVVLGGEHSLTHGCVRGLLRSHDDFGVIQFDAHADLRDSYGGTPQSHASVMRRIAEEGVPILQIGTRSYCLDEHLFRQQHNIHFYDGETVNRRGADSITLPDDFPEKIYISFDVDCFDASVMPATGTPVPGGLDWYQAATLLRNILEKRICIGYDVVELAPNSQFHGASFTAAQLVYNIMGYLVRSPKNIAYHAL